MTHRNITAVRDAMANAYSAQISRALGALRIQGWEFPENFHVGVSIIEATPSITRVNARIDDVKAEATIATGRDVIDAVDALVGEWLAKNATKKPQPKKRQVEASA